MTASAFKENPMSQADFPSLAGSLALLAAAVDLTAITVVEEFVPEPVVEPVVEEFVPEPVVEPVVEEFVPEPVVEPVVEEFVPEPVVEPVVEGFVPEPPAPAPEPITAEHYSLDDDEDSATLIQDADFADPNIAAIIFPEDRGGAAAAESPLAGFDPNRYLDFDAPEIGEDGLPVAPKNTAPTESLAVDEEAQTWLKELSGLRDDSK